MTATELRTFRLPERVTRADEDRRLGRELVRAWQSDGVLRIATDRNQDRVIADAYAASRRFFSLPLHDKAKYVSDLTYTGYAASGEGVPGGEPVAGDEADYSETFTICKDVPEHDARVQGRWPCHGPAPWPDGDYMRAMRAFMARLGEIGETLLELTALGLSLARKDALTRMTGDGWHHLRVLRFPAGSDLDTRSVGTRTGYGLLVITAQDEAGALTVTPGVILQFLTGGILRATPYETRPAERAHDAMAYFHEPNFESCVRPLADPGRDEYVHYGTQFTTMFMRRFPEHMATRRILAEDRLSVLAQLRGHVSARA